jgi:hypothetical protein
VPVYNDVLVRASDLFTGDLRKEMTTAERNVHQRVQKRTNRFNPDGGMFGGGGWENITLGRFNVISGHETVVTLLPSSGKSDASRAVTFGAKKNELSINPARVSSDAFQKTLSGPAPEKAFWLLVNVFGGEKAISDVLDALKPIEHLGKAPAKLQESFASSAKGLSRGLDDCLQKFGIAELFTRDELSVLMSKIAGQAYRRPDSSPRSDPALAAA